MDRKPRVIIYMNPLEVNEGLLSEIMAGLEEEGVPSEKQEISNMEVMTLASRAAKASPLDIGIGISSEIAMTIKQFPKGKMLYYLKKPDKRMARCLGSNAGRYVKGLPLKEVGE